MPPGAFVYSFECTFTHAPVIFCTYFQADKLKKAASRTSKRAPQIKTQLKSIFINGEEL